MNREHYEQTIGLGLPKNFEFYDLPTQQLIIQYLETLDTIERKAYTIGLQHLGSSFNVVKSNGFNDWKKRLNEFNTLKEQINNIVDDEQDYFTGNVLLEIFELYENRKINTYDVSNELYSNIINLTNKLQTPEKEIKNLNKILIKK